MKPFAIFSRLWIWLGVFSLILTVSPVKSPAQEAALNPQTLTRMTEANNRFGFELFARLSAEAPKGGGLSKNIFVSPASVCWALEMLLNGAEGNTLEGMINALALSGIGVSEINGAQEALRSSLEDAGSGVKLTVANGLWGKAGAAFLPDFLAALKKYYGAAAATLQGAEPINAWVKEKTLGKIPSIVKPDSITPETILVLVNAVYFKGLWQRPFDKARTLPELFQLPGGSQPLPMMHQGGSFAYFEDGSVQAIRLPYGQERRLALIVALPSVASGLKGFLQGMDAARWQTMVSAMRERSGTLALPRFKAEYGAELSEALAGMGMGLAFSNQADFKKLAQVPPGFWLKISQVQHKTFVEVNEEGTEAAAATAIEMRAGSAAPPPQAPFKMVVDRPFFVAIQDSKTGMILFLGSVADPR